MPRRSPEEALRAHIHAQAQGAIESIEAATVAQIVYAISFRLAHDPDWEPRQPSLWISLNTEAYLAARGGGDEARWNFAFWPQRTLAVACTTSTPHEDLEGAALRAAWRKDRGLDYPDGLFDENPTRVSEMAETLANEFVRICQEVALELHREGIIRRRLGRAVPILIHELEYHEEIAARTEEANPSGLADDFCGWVRG